jgi:hypothetical protein
MVISAKLDLSCKRRWLQLFLLANSSLFPERIMLPVIFNIQILSFVGNCRFIWEKVSISSRISKGQGYQGFLHVLRKRAGSSFGQKGQFASYKEKLEKLTEFHYF